MLAELARACRGRNLEGVMNTDSIKGAYRRYAAYYDLLFGSVLQDGRRQVVDALDLAPGHRVLEIGVGTGLSLPLYPGDSRVTGVDLSAPMLEVARERVLYRNLQQVEGLHEMDAAALQFPAESFDKVVAMYVMSVVPDPLRVVEEMRRVCRYGGDILIVNHFHSGHPLLRGVERLIAPLSRLLGFRPDFELDGFIADAGLDVVARRRANWLGYWTILHCRVPPRGALDKPAPVGQAA